MFKQQKMNSPLNFRMILKTIQRASSIGQANLNDLMADKKFVILKCVPWETLNGKHATFCNFQQPKSTLSRCIILSSNTKSLNLKEMHTAGLCKAQIINAILIAKIAILAEKDKLCCSIRIPFCAFCSVQAVTSFNDSNNSAERLTRLSDIQPIYPRRLNAPIKKIPCKQLESKGAQRLINLEIPVLVQSVKSSNVEIG